MAKSTPIPAAYEPSAPAPSMPVLTVQSEFIRSPNESPSILTQEVPLRPNKRQFSRNDCEQSPAKKLRFTTPSQESASSSDSQDGPDDGKSIPSDDEEDDGLIPKPPGEARRPKSGGYNLELELNWDAKHWNSLKVSSLH